MLTQQAFLEGQGNARSLSSAALPAPALEQARDRGPRAELVAGLPAAAVRDFTARNLCNTFPP